ncbi:MGH1-like glycoside hydrolase domain-containing protein [Pedobacter heparinus]|uniref:MGH1-like glycoside hydrolase domain-containing protein n=1 Tax=Pedobacter heparinus TaxID=984 RepID=UPI002931A4AC|nr:trehalase family glycosidase [Pedobacter heparinus]
MKKTIVIVILNGIIFHAYLAYSQTNKDWKKYSAVIKKSIYKGYKGMYREEGGALKFPFLTPGSSQYADVLWDWDSWFSNIALRQILLESGTEEDRKAALKYEQGCVLNFLAFSGPDGWIPININRKSDKVKMKPEEIYAQNMHKPCLAQHAAFLVKQEGKAEWLRDKFYHLQTFVNNYTNHSRDRATGLYFWQKDGGIGVDNDPSTWDRPPRSSASILLNCFMYKELKAMVYLCNELNLNEIAPQYAKDAENLKKAIQEHCWDEKDGFFYSVDLNLLPRKNELGWTSHSGAPRDWDGLIQRIGIWSGFLGMWAEIATPEQAKRMVEENYKDTRTFNAPYGVRTLSKLEKMYNLKASGNPSSWLGPIWGISNYLTWKGLVKYGYNKEAKELATKTVILFGRDFERFGALHEYYQPENGEPILNRGFQNWNYLVLNMLAWLENRKLIAEF